jgi:hypothetical protein
MTRTQILAAAAAVLSIIVIVEGVGLLHATARAPIDARPSPTIGTADAASDDRAGRKGDRLPVATLTVESPQPEAAPSPEPSPSPQLEAATEEDLRQADEEHHRHRDICRNGRTYFMQNGHQYWRCKL